MNPERWAKVDRLLDEALERAPSERLAFLVESCGDDAALRDEVLSLLQAHEQADQNFLQTPALEIAARQAAHHLKSTDQTGGIKPDSSLLGRKLEHYQILSVLGAGGMGAVYLARDERLDRKVALKLLPAQFTANTDRIKRFEREARAASALSHPNIITIYDIGETDSQQFIAAEFVEGQTLRALIERGPLPDQEAVEIARQIASALSAAHEAHIIHRDLKPENVMVRKDRLVKVLDFGLARMLNSPSNTSALRQTMKGTVMGTVSYMSPEQALGEDVDHRSDLFSLGTTLYELLTGRQAFAGSTAISIADKVIHQTPVPLRQFNQACPAEFERIVSRLLEKNRDLRYQTAEDLHADLKRLQRSLDLTAPDADTRENLPVIAATTDENKTLTTQSSGALTASPLSKFAVGFAILVLLVTGLLGWRAWVNRSTQLSDGFDWRTARFTELTEYPGIKSHPALSPDGQTLVYTRKLNGQFDLIRQRVGGATMQNLTEGEATDDSQPEFSPQGDLIAFRSERSGGGIFVMGATGESPRLIANQGYNPSWSPDGQELVYSTQNGTDIFNRAGSSSQLWIINLKTGAKRQIAAGPDAVQPEWSPHGTRIVFWGLRNGAQRDIFTVPVTGGEPVAVTNDKAMDGNAVWSHDGRFVYFSSNRNGSLSIWRQAIDEESGMLSGEPELIPAKSANSVLLTIARNGERMAYTNRIVQTNIRRIGFDAARGTVTGESSWVTQMARRATNQSVSPDGQRLTFYTYGDPQFDIYVSRIGGSEAPLQLTNDEAFDRAPRWSPNGERIAFFSNLSGKYEIWTIKADGSERQQLTFSRADQPGYLDPAWSPDGTRMLFTMRDAGESLIMDLNRAYDAQQLQSFPPLPDVQAKFIAYNWSFDSRMLAGTAWTKNGELPGLIVYDLATRKYEQVTKEGNAPFWMRDGQRLIYSFRGKLYLADRRTQTAKLLCAMPEISFDNPTLSADEQFLYCTSDSYQESVWAIHMK
jgi:eukaryotic-like serine/threonine-protein kinase